FEKGKRPNDETAEDSKNANKKKAVFKGKYQESYLNYGFITIGDSHSPSPLCIMCRDQLSNEAMKSSKLLCHVEIKNPELKDKALEFFQRKTTMAAGVLPQNEQPYSTLVNNDGHAANMKAQEPGECVLSAPRSALSTPPNKSGALTYTASLHMNEVEFQLPHQLS
ncbi:SCAN domain-containing protein 3, partial [Pteropus alecto]